jgi:hypothetical protein
MSIPPALKHPQVPETGPPPCELPPAQGTTQEAPGQVKRQIALRRSRGTPSINEPQELPPAQGTTREAP